MTRSRRPELHPTVSERPSDSGAVSPASDPIDDERARAALRLLERALALPAEERDAWLRTQTLTPELRARVDRLLAADAAAGAFLDSPAGEALQAPAMPGAGARLGAWRLLRPLEAGGMGMVYLAERVDGGFEQQVAVKLIRPLHLFAPEAARARLIAQFERERRLLARLNHPHVARVLDGGSSADGLPYLVMEYVEGEPLMEAAARQRLDLAARLRLFVKICGAVQAAHRNLIVHRDLKPANVLVDAGGEPRLLDFGIARALAPEADEARAAAATGTAVTAMTPAYASPEQLRGDPATTASDIYSLGVMLHELLTGQLPFDLDGLSPAAAERRVNDTQPPAPSTAVANQADLPPRERQRRARQLRGDLDRIVARAMATEPERRYVTAAALADDVERHLAGRPVKAMRDGVGYRVGKWIRRQRLAAAALALALLAVALGSGMALWQAQRASLAAADTARINRFLLDVLGAADPFESGGEMGLDEALSNAAGQIALRFGDRPALEGAVRHAIGYAMLGRYRLDDAERELQRALALRRAAHGPAAVETLESLEALALLRFEQGRSDEAAALFAEVEAALDAAGHHAAELYPTTLNDHARLLLAQEQFEPAADLLERARRALDAGATMAPDARAVLLSNLAQARHGLGETEAADALYGDAYTVLRGAYDGPHPDLAIVLNNRAFVAHDLGRSEQALALFEQSLAMRRQVIEGDNPLVLRALLNLAEYARMVERHALAQEYALEAARMARVLHPDAHIDRLRSELALGRLRLALGESAAAVRHAEAAAAFAVRLDDLPASLQEAPEQLRVAACAAAEVPGCAPRSP